MDKGNYTGVLYVDLSKAFDTISHSTITTKLKSFGILGTPKEWFINYLFNRKLLVCYNGTLSSPQPLYCGVPRGSIIGPLLFLIHFNDATNVIRRCIILKYADDTVLFVSDSDIQNIKSMLNSDFGSLCNWLKENQLIINMKKRKTEYMIFGTSQHLKNLQTHQLLYRIKTTMYYSLRRTHISVSS